MAGKRKTDRKKDAANRGLPNLDFVVNEFGHIQSNLDIDQINEFLDRHVGDRKLAERTPDTDKDKKTSGQKPRKGS
jgi:hypothetical protein